MNVKFLYPKSIMAWYLLRVSNPSKNWILSSSKIVRLTGSFLSKISIYARWILPKILEVPTPTAIPANLVSNSLINPHLSAHVYDIIVDSAPLSTKAYIGWPFIAISIYNMLIFPKNSGCSSIANSL